MAENQDRVKITFHGGAGGVTGSNFLVEPVSDPTTKILVDCGLFQGDKTDDAKNEEPWPYQPEEITALFITHAHLDHIGRIPLLVRAGFKGVIYSTAPTKDIADLSLRDSLGLMNKGASDTNQEDNPFFYTEADIKKAMKLWQTIGYHEPVTVGPITAVLRDSGHILGSSMIEMMIDGRKLIFTGDLGNSPTPLLPDAEKVSDADYLVMESVYGDRDHEDRTNRREKLEDVIESTMQSGGTLIIPAFSIERTQEILYEIERMMENSKIPLVPVFIDSPLAIATTKIYKKHKNFLNERVRSEIRSGDDLFGFPQLKLSLTTEESKAIIRSSPRKIIIAGSGMSNGGRIIHHEKDFLPDAKSTLLLVGYQSVGTLGRYLQDGAKVVKILGQEVPVKAKVVNIGGYSAHRDGTGLLNFVADTKDTLKKVFVVMGEPKASLFLVQRIQDYLGLPAEAPALHQEVMLSW